MPENIMLYIFLGFFLFIGVAYFIRRGKNIFAPVTIVDATVVHKQKVETFSKYSGTGKHVKYAVTFLAKDKRLSFYVSSLSYDGYKVGESATLTYKGDRLIDFS